MEVHSGVDAMMMLTTVHSLIHFRRLHRVPCYKQGGMRFTVNGNPWFLLVLVYNVGGAGDVQQLYIKGSSTGWYGMSRNWGQMWQFSGNSRLQGQALSFRAVTSDGRSVTSWNAAPRNWQFGQAFEGSNY